MKNKYMNVKEYRDFIKLFDFEEKDRNKLEYIIHCVEEIIRLKDSTPQKSTKLYLKPIMLPNDYREINKALNTQLEFLLEREKQQKRKELIKSGFLGEKLEEEMKKFEKNKRKELGLRTRKNNNEKFEGEDFTLEDFQNLKNK